MALSDTAEYWNDIKDSFRNPYVPRHLRIKKKREPYVNPPIYVELEDDGWERMGRKHRFRHPKNKVIYKRDDAIAILRGTTRGVFLLAQEAMKKVLLEGVGTSG